MNELRTTQPFSMQSQTAKRKLVRRLWNQMRKHALGYAPVRRAQYRCKRLHNRFVWSIRASGVIHKTYSLFSIHVTVLILNILHSLITLLFTFVFSHSGWDTWEWTSYSSDFVLDGDDCFSRSAWMCLRGLLLSSSFLYDFCICNYEKTQFCSKTLPSKEWIQGSGYVKANRRRCC